MQQANKRRHNSSIFELQPQSMMLTDILDALKTQPQAQRNQPAPTIQFLWRMLDHLKQLCLTKASTTCCQSLTQTHLSNLLTLPLAQSLTLYFQELVPEVQHLVSRLRRVNQRKFSVLIRRKISEMFGEIMRHAYEVKMGVLVERAREKQADRRAAMAIRGMVEVLKRRAVGDAWGRVCAVGREGRRRDRRVVQQWGNGLGKLNRLLHKKHLKLKLGYLNLWHMHTKHLAFQGTSQIHNLVKTIYLSIISVIQDQCQIHSIINLALRKISSCESSCFYYHKLIDNTMIGYESESDEAVVKEATQKELQCMEQNTVGYEEMVLLVPVGEAVGVFRVGTEVPAKVLGELMVLAKGLGDILQKVYAIRSRLVYYDKDCRTLNQLAQQFYSKYLELPCPQHLPDLLDSLLPSTQLSHFQIIFLQNNSHQTFYSFTNPSTTLLQQLTSDAIQMFRDQFLKPSCQPYLQIARTAASAFTIFPIKQQNIVKGLIKFGYPFEVPTDGLVQLLKDFVETMIARSRAGWRIQEEGVVAEEIVVGIGEREAAGSESGLEILKADTYEDLQEAVGRAVARIYQKSYCCLLWPIKSQYFTPCLDQLLLLPSPSLPRSPTPQLLSLRQPDQLATLLKKFPLYSEHRVYEYEHSQDPMNIYLTPIRSKNETICVLLVGAIGTEVTHPKEVAECIKARLREVGGLGWREEHQRRMLKEIGRVVEKADIQYGCFQENIDRMFNAMYGDTKTRVFYKKDNSSTLVDHTGNILQFPKPLPSSPYCSHNRLLFTSCSLRFRRLSLKSHRTALSFRSQPLRQHFSTLIQQQMPSSQACLGQPTTQITSLQQLLHLQNLQYVYLPFDKGFVVVENDRKWTEEEVGYLQKWLGREFAKVREFREGKRVGESRMAIRAVMAVRDGYRRCMVQQLVERFRVNRETRNRRVEILKELVIRGADRKGLLYIFYKFKEGSLEYNRYLLNTSNKLQKLNTTLNSIYFKNTFNTITNFSRLLTTTQTHLTRSLSTLSHLLHLKTTQTLFSCFTLLQTHSQSLSSCQFRNKVKALHNFQHLMTQKLRIVYRSTISKVQERWRDLIEIVRIVAEELKLVGFEREERLVGFVRERLAEPIGRLGRPFQGLLFEVDIVNTSDFKYGNSYLIMGETEHTVKVGWELTNGSILTMILSKKLKMQGQLLQYLLQLKQSLITCHKNIVITLKSKLICLCSTITSLYISNLSSCLKLLSQNVLKSVQLSNKRSKYSLKQIQNQLSSLTAQTQSNKQNQTLSKQLNDCRKQISSLQDTFSTLKIENQLKRKTLAVALMMNKVEQRRQQRESVKRGIEGVKAAVREIEGRGEREQQKQVLGGIMGRRFWTAVGMMERVARQNEDRVCKQAFQTMLTRAYRQLSFLR